MATKTNHWKLGLFVFVGLFAAVGAVIWLGVAEFDKEAIHYVTYFDESVQGLDVGSPVKFRGVTIGNVSRIAVAPDRRHVEVEGEVNANDLTKLGLDPVTFGIPPDLRVQLASAGVTGLKFIQVDFFDVKKHPVPELGFDTPANYIPAAPSMLKSLEDSVVQSVGRFPETTAEAIALLKKLNVLVEEVNQQGLPAQLTTTIDNTNETIAEGRKTLKLAQHKIHQFDVQQISDNLYLASENVVDVTAKADMAMDGINGGLFRLNRILARVERQGGLLGDVEQIVKLLRNEAAQLQGAMAVVKATLESVKATADSIQNVAREADGMSGDLGGMLTAVTETAAAIRRVADALERDPDMLLKGRAGVVQ